MMILPWYMYGRIGVCILTSSLGSLGYYTSLPVGLEGWKAKSTGSKNVNLSRSSRSR